MDNIELTLIQSGMSRKEIINKLERLTAVGKSPEEAAKMLLDAHSGLNLLLEKQYDEEDIFN